jgi:hypothetical protein
MIYNLASLLRTQFAAETIFAIERKSIGGAPVPSRCVLLIPGSGTDQPWTGFGYQMAQVLARDEAHAKAMKLAWDIFNYLNGRWGLKLPAITVDGTAYPEIQTGQISAIARPESIGEDEEGRTEFSTNFQIYWGRK